MTASGREGRLERSGDEIAEPELHRQEPKELPFREGTMDRIVEDAEADPTPAEIVATALEEDTEEQPGGGPS